MDPKATEKESTKKTKDTLYEQMLQRGEELLEKVKEDPVVEDTGDVDPADDGTADDDPSDDDPSDDEEDDPSDPDADEDVPIEVTVEMDAPKTTPEKSGCSTLPRGVGGVAWLLSLAMIVGVRREH